MFQKGGVAAGLRSPPPGKPPPPKKKRKLKKKHFVDTMISEVLPDLPFSRNQPLKSTDDNYTRILKNKLI
jgi:hypothetical protein